MKGVINVSPVQRKNLISLEEVWLPAAKLQKQLLVIIAVTRQRISRTVMDDDVRRWRVLTVVSPCQKAGFSLGKADAFFPLSVSISVSPQGPSYGAPSQRSPLINFWTSVGLLTDCRNLSRITINISALSCIDIISGQCRYITQKAQNLQ